MELKDFTEQEQKQIEKGLSTAEISDKEAAKKLLALVPQEWIKRIPFFVSRCGLRCDLSDLLSCLRRKNEQIYFKTISRYLVCTDCPPCYLSSWASYPLVFPR